MDGDCEHVWASGFCFNRIVTKAGREVTRGGAGTTWGSLTGPANHSCGAHAFGVDRRGRKRETEIDVEKDGKA